ESLPVGIAKELISVGIVPLCGLRQAIDAAEAAASVGPGALEVKNNAGLPGPLSFLRSKHARRLDEYDAKQVLRAAGIAVPSGAKATDLVSLEEKAKRFNFPLALKGCDPDLLHKSEQGAVHLNIEDMATLLRVAEPLFDRFDTVLVEEMVTDAVGEWIVGINHDPAIGPWMLIGAGGVFAELLSDRAVVLLPAEAHHLERAIDSLKISSMMSGYRGLPVGDRQALLSALKSLSDFAYAHSDTLIELEINPLLICPTGKGVCAADAVIQQATPV
ncbi:MAG: acetate--CoA ligase family protein, partial [Arenicellales bacterium]